ncbi:MAG: LuxR family transcriptional regulator [Actinomycetota bacterium]|nr:LuxR family transcriptional regulator [Actinomycetota bacterium]
MWTFIAICMAIIVVLRVFTAFLCAAMALRKDAPPLTKKLAWALTAIQVASLFSFLGRVQAHWQEKAAFEAQAVNGRFVAGQLVSLAIALGGVLIVLWLVTGMAQSLGKTERLARVMITTPFVDVKTSELGLTVRELEVLEVMTEGKVSDQQIADALSIAPTTAATHIRNILHKAGLHNRRDLVLLYGAGRVAAL